MNTVLSYSCLHKNKGQYNHQNIHLKKSLIQISALLSIFFLMVLMVKLFYIFEKFLFFFFIFYSFYCLWYLFVNYLFILYLGEEALGDCNFCLPSCKRALYSLLVRRSYTIPDNITWAHHRNVNPYMTLTFSYLGSISYSKSFVSPSIPFGDYNYINKIYRFWLLHSIRIINGFLSGKLFRFG